jgi:hypothetical protein
MTRITTADKIVWGLVLTVFAGAVGMDMLGHAGVIPLVPEAAVEFVKLGLMIVAACLSCWALFSVTPAQDQEVRRFDLFDWMVFLVGFAPIGLHTATIIANGAFHAQIAPLVSPELVLPGAMLLMAWSIWQNRKYPAVVKT